MDWQQLAALGVVVITAGLFVWRQVRPARFRFHQQVGCGCTTVDRAPGVVVQGRRGEKPRVTLKPR